MQKKIVIKIFRIIFYAETKKKVYFLKISIVYITFIS